MIAKLTLLCFVSGAFGVPLTSFNRGGLGKPSLLSALDDLSLLPADPYVFANDNVDEYGNKQFFEETGDTNNVKTGSYGYTDANGIFRRVKYVADANGFRAKVETNEPGTKAGTTADAVYNADPMTVSRLHRAPGPPLVSANAKKNTLSLGRFPFGHSG